MVCFKAVSPSSTTKSKRHQHMSSKLGRKFSQQLVLYTFFQEEENRGWMSLGTARAEALTDKGTVQGKCLVIAVTKFFPQFLCYLLLCYSGKSPRARRENMRKYHLEVLLTDWLLCSDSVHRLDVCGLGAISRSDSHAICLHNFCTQTILSKIK